MKELPRCDWLKCSLRYQQERKKKKRVDEKSRDGVTRQLPYFTHLDFVLADMKLDEAM